MLYFSRWQKWAFAVLTLALLAGVGALLYGKGRQAALDDGAPFFVDAPKARAARAVLVDISGAVAKPGVYHLLPGTRVHQALAQAGGATKQADLAALNLAATVQDGEKLTVPSKVAAAVTAAIPAVAAQHAPKTNAAAQQAYPPKVLPKKPVSLNSATAEQLQQLPGIGPVLAQRILRERQRLKAETGRGFQSKEQLLEVPGIGPKKYADLKDYVCL